MALLSPEQRFILNLQSFDPLLSVRYSDILQSWVIERKAYLRENEVYYLKRRLERTERLLRARPDSLEIRKSRDGIAEEFLSAQRGARVIFFTRNLDRTCFDRLAMSDCQRYGGYSRMADEIDQLDKQEEKRQERKEMDELFGMNEEAWNQMRFLRDRRSVQLDHGERDLRYLLHGKRSNKPPKKKPPVKPGERIIVPASVIGSHGSHA